MAPAFRGPNAHYLRILDAERAKVKERTPETKYIQTLNKAIRNLQAVSDFMLVSDLPKVDYVGPKLRDLVRKHCERYGFGTEGDEEGAFPDGSDDEGDRPRKKKASTSKKRKAASSSDDDEAPPRKAAKGKGKAAAPKPRKRGAQSSSSEDEAPKASRGKGKGKDLAVDSWHPEHRKPAYGILLALWSICEPDNQAIWAKQSKLEPIAQQYSQTAIVTSDTSLVGSATAFNTLITKALIVKRAGTSQASYCITRAGFELAQTLVHSADEPTLRRLKVTTECFQDDAPAPKPAAAKPKSVVAAAPPPAKRPRQAEPDLDQLRRASPPPPRTSQLQRSASDASLRGAPFGYIYLDEANEPVETRAEADSMEWTEASSLYKIEFRDEQHHHKLARELMLVEPCAQRRLGAEGPTSLGWLDGSKCQDRAPGFFPVAPSGAGRSEVVDSLMAGASKSTAADKRQIYKLPESEEARMREARAAAAERRAGAEPEVGPSRARPRPPSPSPPPVAGPSSQRAQPRPPRPALTRDITGGANASAIRPAMRESNADFDPRTFTSTTTAPRPDIALPPFDPTRETIVMRPGEFEVVMGLDDRERAHHYGMIGQREVPVQKLHLPIGDVVWVARRKVPSGNADADMIVLDGVLERKRVDDLVSSLKDKRYDEQKARMRASGMTRMFYLLEYYGNQYKTKDDNFGQAVWTCKSQVQVVDGFQLLEAAKEADARQHLIDLTKIYAELYEGTTLYAIPERYVQRASYLSLQHHLRTSDPDRTYLTTFGGFANVSAPNYTVGIDYAQSLLCVKGLSASKVVDVIQQWPTPYALYTDLDRVRAETEIERVEFDRKLAAGKLPKIRANAKHKPPTADGYIKSKAGRDSTRGIKDSLSKQLFELYTTSDYRTIVASPKKGAAKGKKAAVDSSSDDE